MKNYYLIIAFCFGLTTQAQIINFADANFKSQLLQTNSIDTNHDEEIEVSEALTVNRIYFDGAAVSSLSGIEYFTNLKELQFSSTLPIAVDIRQLTNLELFSTFDCNVTSFNAVGLSHLRSIYMRGASLTSIDFSGMTSLEAFSCDNCGITSLNLSGLNNLVALQLWNMPMITSLDLHGLPALTHLWACYMPLTSLNVSMVPTLQHLDCDNSLITSLNLTGLANLYYLDCEDNHLTTLDLSTNTGLGNLRCDNNQLTTLDVSHNPNLSHIYCSGNQLTDLDLSHSAFRDVSCGSNHLTTLNLKNNFLDGEVIIGNHGQTSGSLIFNNNPGLRYICADDIELSYVEEKITQYSYINCHINSYCSFVPGGVFYTIAGTNRFDFDGNGCDANDAFFPYLKFNITDGTVSGSAIADVSGSYSIAVQAGTHTITPVLENPAYFSVSPASATITFPTESSPFTQHFCIAPVGVHNDLEVNLLPIVRSRPGFDAVYKIIYKNKGNQTLSGIVSFAYNDSAIDFVSSSVTPSSLPMNYINWNFTNLHPFESKEIYVTFNVNSPTETPPVTGGFVLPYTLSINSGQADETPGDNIFILRETVVNSFDPNDKICLEGNTVTPEIIGKDVHYIIHFENTGNANTENIVIKDVIDTTKFDIATLIPLDGSHPFVTKISGSKVEFIFENINLPFDDAHNDGYVAFKIKTTPGLSDGDSFSNSASIYFDFNAPINTNTAVTAIQALASPVFEVGTFTITPNPTKAMLYISSEENTEIVSIRIYNILGQLVTAISKPSQTIDVSGLTTGTYLINIVSEKGTTTTKFIKN